MTIALRSGHPAVGPATLCHDAAVQPLAGDLPPAGAPLTPPPNRLPWILGGLATLVVVAFVVVLVMALSRDDAAPAGQSATTSGFEDEPTERGLDPARDDSDETVDVQSEVEDSSVDASTPVPLGEPSEQPDPPEESVNLLSDGAESALADLSAAIGADTAVVEVVVYDTYVIAEYQDPAAPENVDRVIWRDGVVSEPDPVGFSDGDTTPRFMIDEIDLAQIPPLATTALNEFDLDGGVVTHVIIDRFFGLDDGGIAFRVYVSHPERGGGGYLLARVDGTVVELID